MQNRVLQIHEKMHEMQNFPDEIMVTEAKSSAYQVLNTQNAELSLAPCAIYSEKFCILKLKRQKCRTEFCKSVKNNKKCRT